jgi:hypothetical protein
MKGVLRHPLFAGSDDPQPVDTSESEKQDFLATNAFFSGVVDNLLKTVSVKGSNDASNVLPGIKLTPAQLKALKLQSGNYKDKLGIYRSAEKATKEKFASYPGVSNAVMGQYYKVLFSESDGNPVDLDEKGSLANKLLDISVEKGKDVRQIRTNCVWFSPDDLKGFSSDVKRTFDREQTLGQQTDANKPKQQLISETLRVASIPCVDNPENIMCFDSFALVQYMNERMRRKYGSQTKQSPDSLNAAIKRGEFRDIPVPREFQKCAGGAFLTDEQLLLVLRHYISGQALDKLLPTLSSSDIESLLAVKDELINNCSNRNICRSHLGFIIDSCQKDGQ